MSSLCHADHALARRLLGNGGEKIGHRLEDRFMAGLRAVPAGEPMRIVVAKKTVPAASRQTKALAAAGRRRSFAPPASAACRLGIAEDDDFGGASANPTVDAAAAWSTRAATLTPRWSIAAASRSIVSFASWRLARTISPSGVMRILAVRTAGEGYRDGAASASAGPLRPRPSPRPQRFPLASSSAMDWSSGFPPASAAFGAQAANASAPVGIGTQYCPPRLPVNWQPVFGQASGL